MARKKADKGKKSVAERARRLQELRVTYVGVGDIAPNTWNPNRQSAHDFELLLRSMDEDGFTQPIIVQEDTATIVDGEHRWTAWMILNHLYSIGKSPDDCSRDEIGDLRDRRLEILNKSWQLPVVMVDFGEAQRRISTFRHNRARGSEDVELSAQLLRDLRELGALEAATKSLMMDPIEVDILLKDIPAREALAADDFGEAWSPGLIVGKSDEKATTSMTQAAVDAVRKREQRISDAITEEDKETVRRESTTFRVIALFSNEQAATVKAVLGDQPAERILHLCEFAEANVGTIEGLGNEADEAPEEVPA